MKKKFNTRLTLAGMAVVISLCAGAWVTSCQKEAVNPKPDMSAGITPKAEWTYLDFTEGYTGIIENPCDSNAVIITEAINRIKFLQKDGWWEIGSTTPEQLEMSSSLFEYVCRVAERSNTSLTEALQNEQYTPRTRAIWETHLEMPNDCVAQSMGYMSGYLGYPGVTHSSVDSYVNRWYPNGLLSSQVLPLMQSFYGRDNVSSISAGRLQNIDLSQSGVMMTYSTGGDNGHAVVYISTADDGSYNVYDPQQNMIDNINSGSVLGIYHVLKNH